MAVNLSPIWGAGAQLFDNSGNVLTGGKIYTYAAGTTTPATTYTSSNGITANSNPIILNSAGRVPYEIWLTDGTSYKFVLKDSNDTLIATYDNLVGINSNFVAFTLQQDIQTATAGQTVFNLTMQYQPATNSLSVFVDGVNQYGPGAQYAYVETDSDTVTFVNGLHAGALVKFTTAVSVSSNYSNAENVTYDPPFTGSVTTNVEAKLSETVSVKDFGAVGDGVTDDTDAIQAALNSGAKNVFLDDGSYFLANASMLALPYNGLTAPSGIKFYGSSKATLLLDGASSYAHVLVVGSGATDVTFENITIDGQGAFSNGIVMAGLGGGDNNNCHAIRCTVIDIHSERTPSGGSFVVNQGGVAFVVELPGYGTITDCSAINCQFGIRYAPGTFASVVRKANYSVNNFYAEECESILNTTPSAFDNRDYSQSATYNKIMPCQLVMNGVVFKNCGKSTDQMTQFSFVWKDSSAELGGRATGNYNPWAGVAHGSGTVVGTYAGLNWMPATYSAADSDWNSASTYSAGNRVKITNNGNLGALFSFGRAGGVTISNVRGWNDHYSGAYPRIGAVFRGIMRGVNIYNVAVDVACDSIFSFGITPSSTWDLQPFMISQYVYADNVFVLGSTTTVADSNMPWNGTWHTSTATTYVVDYQFNVQYVYLTNIQTRAAVTSIASTALSTTAPAQATTFDSQTNLEWIDSTNGTTTKGRFGDYQNRISGAPNNNFRETLGQTTVAFLTGTGTPEGSRVAPVGSIYLRTDGGAGTTFYIKETGTSNTGWVGK